MQRPHRFWLRTFLCIFFMFLLYLDGVANKYSAFVSPVCISLYETVTGSSEGEMPYHWYTDQRFALFIMCLVIILPLSIPKEIGIQKYTRYVSLYLQSDWHPAECKFFCDLTLFSSRQCVGDAGCYISVCGSDCQILPDGKPYCHNNSRAQSRVSDSVL